MADSRFKIKNGLIVEAGPSEVTGSLNAPNITGSLFGTASWALNTVSASFATTASYVLGGASINTGSFLVTASAVNTTITFTKGDGSTFDVTVSQSGSVSTASYAEFAETASYVNTAQTASYVLNAVSASYAPPAFIDNFVTVGLPGSDTDYTSIKTAVDSITDASVNNTYTVRVYPGVYIEDTITVPSYVAIKGDSSTTTIVSASNPSASIFVMSDQTMVIDMQVQGSVGPGASAIYYSSPTTPQTNAIAYAENIRFGTNYTNATCAGTGSGNCILQCSNVKYGGYTDSSLKTFDIGFRVTGSAGSIGRMQLRNVTSTNGGVAGSSQDQIFALADAPGCTFIVNGCLLTRATGAATGTGFKVYNGGQLRLTAVNFQRWTRGIWAPQTGSAPSVDAIALNFENCTTDVAIEHTGSLGKVSGTDNFLKTQIALAAPLYEVGQDPRRITVAKKGGDFTSISASVAYITDSAENNRYVIEIGPGEFTEKQIDMRNKPYIALLGSDIQTTVIVPSGSGTYDQLILGPTNEISFLSLKGNNVAGYSAITAQDLGSNFSQAHKVSIYDHDYGIKVLANSGDTTFYGEYVDINGEFSYGTYVSSSNGYSALASLENYYLFPSNSAAIGNYATGPSSSFGLYTCLFEGDGTPSSTALKIERGAVLEATSLDVQTWDYGVQVPNTSPAPDFRIVGSMFHDSVTYDFEVLNASTTGRFQGVASHTKISNASEDFYWNFLDDVDGENDITRNLAVTFADGTHTDASTLIFKGSPMGVMQGGEITISGSLTITTAAGFGYLQDAIDAEVYKRIDWVNTDLTLTANTNNYIYLNDNGILSAAGSAPDSETNIVLGRVVTNDTGIEFIDQSPYNGEHMSNKLSLFNREALGPVFADGSIVTEDATPFKLDVTQGTYFFSENKFTPAGTSSINLTQYYQSASVWARYTSSIVPNNVYASGSALVAMSASYYTKHTVYLVGEGVDEEYFLVVNNNQYSSLVATENADLPTIPTYFNDGVVPLAAVYVQSGSANITQIQDIRPIIGFRAAGVNASSVHGNLLGLTADDHLQYLRVDGFREMSGDLGLGGNDIYNVGYVSASEFRGPLANITEINATSVTASFNGNLTGTATTASYVLNAVSSSFATNAATASFVTLAQTASFVATASWAQNARTASFVTTAQTASYVLQAVSASFATTASFVTLAQTASFVTTAQTASFVTTAQTASYVLQAVSASFATNAATASFVTTAQTASFVATASWAQNARTASFVTTAQTASYVLQAISASFATNSATASFVTLAQTASFVTTAQTASFVNTAQTASYVLQAVSSSFATTASYALNAGVSITIADEGTSQGTATFINFIGDGVTATVSANTASITIPGGTGATFPYTGSAIISGSLIVTGSVSATQGGFTGSLLGTSSWAQNSVTASFITLAQTASFVTTAQTASYVLQAISSSFATNAATASFVVLAQTASYVQTAQTASFVTTAQTASFVTLAQTASFVATASWAQNARTASFVTLAQTASFVQTAQTASFVTTAQTASFVTTAQTASYVTGSVFTSTNQALTASYALTASFALNAGGGGLTTKAGSVANSSFAGNPRKATVTFGTAFPDTNYAISVTGEDSRTWTIESKLAGSFVINANSNVGLTGTTYWIATAYGETT